METKSIKQACAKLNDMHWYKKNTNSQLIVKISLGYTPSPCEFEIDVSLSDMPNYAQISDKFEHHQNLQIFY